MALITCPECGGKISDLAAVCIHCGYPIKSKTGQNEKRNICTVDGIQYDLSQAIQAIDSFYNDHPNPDTEDLKSLELYISIILADSMSVSNDATTVLSHWIVTNRKIPKTFDTMHNHSQPVIQSSILTSPKYIRVAPIHTDEVKQPSILTCPKCGSTAVTTGARGVNFTLGLVGAAKTVNRCGKCGYTWKPKK